MLNANPCSAKEELTFEKDLRVPVIMPGLALPRPHGQRVLAAVPCTVAAKRV